MKLALTLSGLVRGPIEWCYKTLEDEILNKFEPKVYLQAYTCEDLNRIKEIYNPWKMVITSRDESIESMQTFRKFPETRAENILYMWRNVYRSSLLVDDDTEHMIRSRYDVGFTKGTHECLNKLIQNSLDEIYIPIGGDNRGGLFDMFAIGSKNAMKVYSELYLYITQYIQAGVPVHSELLLRYHLDQKGIKVKRFNMPVGLCRPSDIDVIFRGNTLNQGHPEKLAERRFNDQYI